MIVYSERLAAITPHPTHIEDFRCSSSLQRVRPFPKTSNVFLFVPLVRLFRSFRCSHFNHWVPLTLAASNEKSAAGMFLFWEFCPNMVGVFVLRPAA